MNLLKLNEWVETARQQWLAISLNLLNWFVSFERGVFAGDLLVLFSLF